MIATRPDHLHGNVEVEAKVGVLKERISGQRLALPILVETSTCYVVRFAGVVMIFFFNVVLAPESLDLRFESNMSVVSSRSSLEKSGLTVCLR